MLQAAPKGVFSRDYVLSSDAGVVAGLDVSNWRERAEFTVGGEVFRLERDGMGGPFLLRRGETVVAQAEKPSAFSSRFIVTYGQEAFELRKLSMWSRGFGAFHAGREVGRIVPAGVFSRKANVHLPDGWPIPLQVFVFWLVLVIWSREAAAASA
jgi:hypothetical protein